MPPTMGRKVQQAKAKTSRKPKGSHPSQCFSNIVGNALVSTACGVTNLYTWSNQYLLAGAADQENYCSGILMGFDISSIPN